jgi:predicted DNA-binding transcriptional regulator YafY
MLASRLLTILMLLQSKGRLSARELAEEFEVSVRTIYRDVDQLSAAGVPIYADRGRNGGFQLLDGYRTKLTGMTQPEAETLFLAGLPGPAAELGLADILSTARLKLLSALPATVQPQAERIASRFYLDPAGWFRAPDPQPSLQTIARAVWSGHFLKLRYRPAGEVDARPRLLGPLGLVLKAGVWYLVAQSGKSIRTYRAANILDAEITDQAYERPRKFDLAAHWDVASREYERGVYKNEADIRLSPRGMQLISLLGPYVSEAAMRTAGEPDEDGWVKCRVPVESIGYGVRELMRLGEEVEVLTPPVLREKLTMTLSAMLARHPVVPSR